MPTLKDDLIKTCETLVQATWMTPAIIDATAADAWHTAIVQVLRRHPYDLMQLATVRKVNPNIDTLPAPERDDTATDYFKDDPQGKGW